LALPGGAFPTLNLGPCKSPKISISLPLCAPARLILGMTSSKAPTCLCEELSLMTSTPALMRFSKPSPDHVEGPSVATILVRRGDGFDWVETFHFKVSMCAVGYVCTCV